MKIENVNPPCCGNCPYSVDAEGGNRYCRRWPPTAEMVIRDIPKRNMATGRDELTPVKIGTLSEFTPVQAVQWCGEHPRIKAAVAAGENWVKPQMKGEKLAS